MSGAHALALGRRALLALVPVVLLFQQQSLALPHLHVHVRTTCNDRDVRVWYDAETMYSRARLHVRTTSESASMLSFIVAIVSISAAMLSSAPRRSAASTNSCFSRASRNAAAAADSARARSAATAAAKAPAASPTEAATSCVRART